MNKESMRLVQLMDPQHKRRVALVQEPFLVVLHEVSSIYDLALKAIHSKKKITDIVPSKIRREKLDYTSIYHGESEWKLLPSFDNPEGPLGCVVSGTGLTHKNSALNRQMMHTSGANESTDSLRMYQLGVEGGSPGKGTIGIQPEWFYKGNGLQLKAHGETLEVPSFANDGGEEPEVAGLYIIDEEAQPWRIGFTTGNEFSDHVMEKKNYLYLAPSKLRECAIGPEVIVDTAFDEFTGEVKILRNKELVWSSDIRSGEKNMAHSLENLEHHHFKYPLHRIPLQAHVHFFGADAFSFGNGIQLEHNDIMSIQWNGLGRALQNPINIIKAPDKLVTVKTL